MSSMSLIKSVPFNLLSIRIAFKKAGYVEDDIMEAEFPSETTDALRIVNISHLSKRSMVPYSCSLWLFNEFVC